MTRDVQDKVVAVRLLCDELLHWTVNEIRSENTGEEGLARDSNNQSCKILTRSRRTQDIGGRYVQDQSQGFPHVGLEVLLAN